MCFKDTITLYSRRKYPFNIYNSTADHALLLCEELLAVASKEHQNVRIVSENLYDRVYYPLITPAKKLLQKQKIQIVILDPTFKVEENDFAKSINESDNGELFFAQKRLDNIPHFFLVDKSKYRMETDHINSKAIANFNNRAVGVYLYDFFDSLMQDPNVTKQNLTLA